MVIEVFSRFRMLVVSRMAGWLKLAFAVFCIWFFLWVFTPFWVSFSPLQQRFAAVQEEMDIPIGALYYNDLPFINDAAMMLRDTWRFLPRDMEDKKARARTAPFSKPCR